jgi:3-oxoacyl-[acyl-carrier protein] reductase
MKSPTRVCLITGSATGIGAACAVEFARQGWHIGICYFGKAMQAEADAVAQTCVKAGAEVLVQELDVTQNQDCKRVAQALTSKWGRLDALVNSAGTTRFIAHANLDALDADEFKRVYEVNLIGVHQMISACAPALADSGAGSIVNISSVGGVLGRGSSVAYAASKGALNTLTLALARALAPAIRVNAIAPGFVDGGLPSRVLDRHQHDEVLALQTQSSVLKRVSQPAEVASLAWFLCANSPGITGDVILLDNGLHLNAG